MKIIWNVKPRIKTQDVESSGISRHIAYCNFALTDGGDVAVDPRGCYVAFSCEPGEALTTERGLELVTMLAEAIAAQICEEPGHSERTYSRSIKGGRYNVIKDPSGYAVVDREMSDDTGHSTHVCLSTSLGSGYPEQRAIMVARALNEVDARDKIRRAMSATAEHVANHPSMTGSHACSNQS